ncbi:HlyD family secretion protein [Yoonia algicola]|uniref:HlyD family efflux transporter periplasmic adaptor subunit n=1 Tax=Yoonia algicola TaxID=3137368 RepID=A0AAN0M473_9RHOB
MKFVRMILAVVGVLAAVAAVAWYVWDQNTAGLPAGFAGGNGRIEAEQIDIATRTPGRVDRILVNEGDLIEAGQLLAVMDTRELEAQLARAQADVSRAESQIDEVRALIAQREAELALAQEELSRALELAERGVTSQAAADQQQARQATATAALNAAMAQLHTAERSVDSAAALVQLYEAQIADATLVAPVMGRVLYRLAQPGEVLGGGGRVLTMLDLGNVYMEVFLPADEAMRAGIGAEARVRLDSIPYAIPAFVSFVSPEAQFTPRTVETAEERADLMFRVKVRVPEELVAENIALVRTGLRGMAYVRLAGAEELPWPAEFVGEPIPSVGPVTGETE